MENMSDVKERSIGAVTIMNDKDAAKVWELFQGAFAFFNAPEEQPDPEDLEVIAAYQNNDPDYQAHFPSEDVKKLLGL